MGKIIPLVYPILRGLPDHAIYTAGLVSEIYRNNWISNQYIHMTCNKNFKERKCLGFDFFVDYQKCPYYLMGQIPGSILQGIEKSSLWILLQDCLDNNYFVQLFLDESKLDNRQFTGAQRMKVHNNCLYGYDNEKVYLGYFNKHGKYEYGSIFKESFLKYLVVNDSAPFIIAKQIENNTYKINLRYIRDSLEDYCASVDLAVKNDYPIKDTASPYKAFGIEVYKYAAWYYKSLTKEELPLDIRPLFMLEERFSCMLQRVSNISKLLHINLSYFLKQYEELLRKQQISKNLLLKYFCTQDEKCLYTISDNLLEMADKEYSVLKSMLKEF